MTSGPIRREWWMDNSMRNTRNTWPRAWRWRRRNVTGPAEDGIGHSRESLCGRRDDESRHVRAGGYQLARRRGAAPGTEVPEGNWKVMAFYLDATIRPASQKGAYVDYLDSTAMDAFISLSYQKHFDRYRRVLREGDQVLFLGRAGHAPRRRTHVDGILQHQGFEKQYGFSPMKYYPALWYDIGPRPRRRATRCSGIARTCLRPTS